MIRLKNNIENALSPLDWPTDKLARFACVKYGKQKPKQNGKYPVIGSSGIYGSSNLPLIDFPTLIVGRKGNAGSVQLVTTPCWPSDTTFYLEWHSKDIDVYFLYFYMLFNRLSGEHAKTTMPSLQRQDLENYTFPIISHCEQSSIVFVLTKLQQAIEQQEKIIEKTKELKRSLMHRLFTYGLRGEELKETEIGLMPESWDVVRLGDDNVLKMVQYGISVRGESSGKYPILRMNSIVGGYVVAEKLQYVDIPLELFEKFSLEQEDILFNRTNSIDLVGKTGIFNLTEKYTFASYLIRLRTNKRKLNSEFLNLYLNLESSQERLKTLATRGVSQSNISGSRLKTLCIPLPPDLDEQKEIAHILSSVDKKLSQAESRKQALQALFKSMLQLLMTGQVRVKDIYFGEACE